MKVLQVLFTCTFFILFSVIVALIWRKNVLKKENSLARIWTQDSSTSVHFSIHSFSHHDFHVHLQSCILDSTITSSCVMHACSLSNLAKIKQKRLDLKEIIFNLFLVALYYSIIPIPPDPDQYLRAGVVQKNARISKYRKNGKKRLQCIWQ